MPIDALRLPAGLPNAQCPMPNAQSPMPNPQCPIPNAQCPIPNPQCPMPNAQSPIPNAQSPMPNPQCPMPNPHRRFAASRRVAQCPIPNAQFPILYNQLGLLILIQQKRQDANDKSRRHHMRLHCLHNMTKLIPKVHPAYYLAG